MAEGTNDGLSILDRIKQFDSSSQPTQPVSQVRPKKPSLKKRPGQKAHVVSSHGHIAKFKPPPLTKKISSNRLVFVENGITSPKSKNADCSSRLPSSPSKPAQLNKPAMKPPVATRNKPLKPMRSFDDNSKPSPPKTKPVVATRNKVNNGTEQHTTKKSVENSPVEASESTGSISALAKKFEVSVSASSESTHTNGLGRTKPKIVQRKISKELADAELEKSTPKSVAQRWKKLEESSAARSTSSSQEVSRSPKKVQVKKLPNVTSTSGSTTAGEVTQPEIPAPKSFLHQNRPSRKSRSGSRKSPSVKTRPLLPSDGRDKITAVTVEEEDWDEEEYEDVLLPPRKVPSEGKAHDSDSWETDDDDDHEYHDIYESIAISPPDIDTTRHSKSTVVPKPTLPPPPVPSKPVRNRLARDSASSEDMPPGGVNTVPKPPRTTGKNKTLSPNPPDRVTSLAIQDEATNTTKTLPATIPRNVPNVKANAERVRNKKIPPAVLVEGSPAQTKGLGKYTGVKSFLHNMLAKSKSGSDLTVEQSLNPSSCPDTLSPLASGTLDGRNWKSLEKLGGPREEYEPMTSTKTSVGVPNLTRRDDRPPATLPRRDLTEQQWPSMDSDSTYMCTEYLDIVEFPENTQDDDDDYILPDNGDDEVYEDVLVSRGAKDLDMSSPLSDVYVDFDEGPTFQPPNLQMEGSGYETPMFPGGEMPAFLTPINQSVEKAHSDNPGADLRVDYVANTKRNNRQSRFFHEPLYQVYRAQNSARSIRSNRSDANTEEELDVVKEEDDDDYEDVPSMSASEASLKRTMWKDLPEVRSSEVLKSLSPNGMKLQEALFEVVTSEASYLRSLNILVDHFMPGLIRPLSRTERTHLFSNCKEVRDQSERLLLAMESQLSKDIRLTKVPDLVLNHARSYFEEYIKYCRNLVYQERVLRRLTTENTGFHSMLQKLEVDRMCAGLDLQSFLILPMQRIARMPLLFDAIIQRAEVGTSLYNSAYRAYKFLSKTLKACNEEARIMAKTEEIVLLQKQLTFKPGVKEIAVVSGKRYLVKKGELTQITQEKKKYLRQPLHLFLFTDLLLITKKKSDTQYTIIDYSERSFLEAKEKEDPDFALAATKLTATQKIRRFTGTLTIPPIESLFTMELFENHEGKHVMMDLATTLSERTRWVEAIMPPKSDVSGETIYEEWDCPQVQVIHPYQAQQPDELELERSDIINVSRKMADGWYEGERIRDGEKGWFPSSYTEEIENSHARARNLKYKHRRQLSLGEA